MPQESTTAQRGYHVPATRTKELINDVAKLFSGEGKVQATVTGATGTQEEGVKFVPVNRAGVVSVTLEASPQQGQEVWVLDISGAADNNNITVLPGAGHTVAGGASVVIDRNNGYVHLQFIGTDWIRLPSKTLSAGTVT